MYRKIPDNLVNVAAMVTATTFLGPGTRSALWVRGCTRDCPGCIAPDWQSPMPEQLRGIAALSRELLIDNPQAQGITISGGEPFQQAQALAAMLKLAKSRRDFDVVIYSGYQRGELESGSVPHSRELLSLADVLIDGSYVAALNQNRGLMGSSNQKVHHLTEKLRWFDFSKPQRQVEFRIWRGNIFLVGVPGENSAEAFFAAVHHSQKYDFEVAGKETGIDERK